MEDEEKLRRFNEEMEKQQFTSNVDPNTIAQNPQGPQGPQNTAIQEQAQISNIMNNQGPPPSPIPTSSGRCEQCGTYHPPIKDGEKCPVAPVKGHGGEELDLNPFFAQLKNICMSQIQQKGIKNYKKLFQFIIIEITKSLENYSE